MSNPLADGIAAPALCHTAMYQEKHHRTKSLIEEK